MPSESIRNESPAQTPQPPVPQTEAVPVLEEQRWNPVAQMSDSEERNRYHHFHCEWAVRTYGVQAVSLPPQHFFQDPTYPPYLRNIGMTVLGMYINRIIIKFYYLHFLKKEKFNKQDYFVHSSLQAIYTDLNNIDTGSNNIQHEQHIASPALVQQASQTASQMNIEIRDQQPGTPVARVNDPITSSSQQPIVTHTLQST